MTVTIPLKRSAYDRENLAVAKVVLEDPARWGPGLVEWARMVIEKQAHGGLGAEPIPGTLAREEFEKFARLAFQLAKPLQDADSDPI